MIICTSAPIRKLFRRRIILVWNNVCLTVAFFHAETVAGDFFDFCHLLIRNRHVVIQPFTEIKYPVTFESLFGKRHQSDVTVGEDDGIDNDCGI